MPNSAGNAPGGPVNIRLQTTLVFNGATDTPEAETALHQAAQKAVYTMAAGECAVITTVFPGDCRLKQIQVSSRTITRRLNSSTADGVTAQGSFTFVITP